MSLQSHVRETPFITTALTSRMANATTRHLRSRVSLMIATDPWELLGSRTTSLPMTVLPLASTLDGSHARPKLITFNRNYARNNGKIGTGIGSQWTNQQVDDKKTMSQSMLDSQAKLDLVNDIVFTSRPRTRSAVPAPGVIDHRRKNLVVVKSNSHDHGKGSNPFTQASPYGIRDPNATLPLNDSPIAARNYTNPVIPAVTTEHSFKQLTTNNAMPGQGSDLW
ncbi:hypothetical protein V8E55_006947 [Tylopilus felleus]